MVICVIYYHHLPFYLICGVHLAKFTSFLPHVNKNCLEKIFSVALGVHLHPLHLPGYAYGSATDLEKVTVKPLELTLYTVDIAH